jgi:Ca2+-binding EF-hand superfamily protein
VTLSEMQAQGAARFARADTDGDGFLSLAELEAAGQERASDRAAKMLSRMDANDDGKLSIDEMKHPRRDPARFFERMDADSSGGISEAEFQEARAKMQERRGGKGHGGKGHGDN